MGLQSAMRQVEAKNVARHKRNGSIQDNEQEDEEPSPIAKYIVEELQRFTPLYYQLKTQPVKLRRQNANEASLSKVFTQ